MHQLVFIGLIAVTSVNLVVEAKQVVQSERQFEHGITMHNGEQVILSGVTEGVPKITIASLSASGQLSEFHLTQFQPDVFQGYSLAFLVDSSPSSASQQQIVNKAKEQIVLFGKEGIYRLHLGKVMPIIKSASIYRNIDPQVFSPLTHSYDVNGDGLSDFILPDIDKHHLYVQTPTGQFDYFPLDIGMPVTFYNTGLDTSSFNVSYLQSIQVQDVNADGKRDIIVANQHEVVWFEQLPQGQYASNALPLRLPLSSNKSLSTGLDIKAGAIHRILAMRDLNHDGLQDLVIERKKLDDDGSEQQSVLMFCASRATDGFTTFESNASPAIVIEGEMIQHGFADFNGDSLQEFYYVSGDIGAGSVMSAFFGGGFDIDINIHQQRQHCQFDRSITSSKETRFVVDVQNTALGSFIATQDLDADGKADLLVKRNDNKLSFYRGQEKKLLSRKANTIKLKTPVNPQHIKVIQRAGISYLLSLGKQFTRQLNVLSL